nr:hypothetical protein [uncultured Carboxylicivirga sp.]
MTFKSNKITFIYIALLLAIPATGQKRNWAIEFMPGISITSPMPLKVDQQGYERMKITAKYKTEPFSSPIYYSYRLSTFKNNKGWGIELNHLKVFLSNTNNVIQQLSVSHGYNQVYINHYISKDKYMWILGAGAVIAHPESKIRDQIYNDKGGLFNDGYYLSGITSQLAIQYALIDTKHFSLPVEAKISAAYSKIPITNGNASIPIVAFHLLMGPCFKW